MKNSSRLLILFGLYLSAAVSAEIAVTGTTPNIVRAGQSTPVTVTARIEDPSVIPGSVQLQQLDSAGKVVALMGILAPASAGDGRYSIEAVVKPAGPGTLTLRVSAAFRGNLTRSVSSPVSISVK